MKKKSFWTSRRLGIVTFLAVFAVFGVLFSKDRISTWLMSGSTIQVHFAGDYKLRPDVSKVKLAFVPVGKVTAVDRQADGSAVVTLKVSDDALKALGTAPSATIRPTTVLGGSYFVDLARGGDPGTFHGEIPESRTALPVELDSVTQALQPDALKAMQGTVRQLDRSLARSGRPALQRLMEDAPGTLVPAARVVDAARGERPTQDWQKLVPGAETGARVATADPGQLQRILSNLDATSASLGAGSPDLALTVHRLPRALANARTGLTSLDSTLQTLTSTSSNLRPVASQLRTTLDDLNPVLAKAVPVVRELRPIARDLRPSVKNLVPATRGLTHVVNDVRGPVIDRVNGPVLSWLNSTYTGTGPYSTSSTDKKMYEEIGYTAADVARASAMVDANGHAIAFQPGLGAGSVGGLPISLEQYLNLSSSWLVGTRPARTSSGVLPPTINGLIASLLGRR